MNLQYFRQNVRLYAKIIFEFQNLANNKNPMNFPSNYLKYVTKLMWHLYKPVEFILLIQWAMLQSKNEV